MRYDEKLFLSGNLVTIPSGIFACIYYIIILAFIHTALIVCLALGSRKHRTGPVSLAE